MAAKNNSVTVNMKFDKMTKTTVRFAEEKESEFTGDVIGTIYIPKATLGQLGYAEGDTIKLTAEVVKAK